MNIIEILSLIINFLLASGLVGTLVFFRAKARQAKAEADHAEIQNTDKIVNMQAEQIDRLDTRVEKLEEKVGNLEFVIQNKDAEIDRKQMIIRQAYKCVTSADECPVLIKRREVEKEYLKQSDHNQ